MFRARWCFTTFSSCSSGILEQRVSGIMDGKMWTIAWPAPSHDLNSSDFYFCGYVNSTVFATEVSDVRDLQRRIQNRFEMFRRIPARKVVGGQTWDMVC